MSFYLYRKNLMLSLKNLEKKDPGKVNAQSIQQALSNKFLDHTYIIYNAYIFAWESDYFSVSESGHVYEIEIKVTKNDFKKDFKKEEKHILLESKNNVNLIPNKFYYATPRGLLPSFKIPEYAGLIEINNTATGMEAEIIKNAPFLHREDVFENLKPQLLSKFYFKYRRTEYDNYELNKEIEILKEQLKSLTDAK